MPRNYKKEYKNYHKRPEQIKRRKERNKARAIMMKRGLVKKGDNMDVHHINFDTSDNSKRNLKILPRSINRKIMPKKQTLLRLIKK